MIGVLNHDSVISALDSMNGIHNLSHEMGSQNPINSARQSRLGDVSLVCVIKLHTYAFVPRALGLTLNSTLINEPIAGSISNVYIFIAHCMICLLPNALASNHDLYGNNNLSNAIRQS